MKIAIIGGGWVGCHLAMKLKNDHKVTIFERNHKLFLETSYNNQNRLHQGYHYARNSKTRELCENTFDRFITEYPFLVENVFNNAYAIVENESSIDYGTFKKIFHDYTYSEADLGLDNLQDVVLVNEKYINFLKASEYFNEQLGHLVINTEITKASALKEDFDLVINCTNNRLPDPKCKSSFYELTITLLFEKTGYTPFGALTLIDGDFISIYPYNKKDGKEIFTVSDVKYTPVEKFNKIKEKDNFRFSQHEADFYKEIITARVSKYYPEFKDKFKYNSFFLSTKSKYTNQSADRSPVISRQDNVINCFTGKIQGIYVIEDYLKNEIANW